MHSGNSSWSTWSPFRKTWSNSLSSVLSISSSAVSCGGYNPDRTLWHRSTSTHCWSAAEANPTKQGMRTLILQPCLTCRLAVKPRHRPCARNTDGVQAHELITLLTCLLGDNLLEMVMPSTFKDLTRAVSGSGGGSVWWCLFLLSEKTISADLERLSIRLFIFDHSRMWSISCCRPSTLHARMIM